MTNKGHVAQTLQTPVVSIVVMILHDNWGMKNCGDKAISVNTTKSNRNKWHKRHERTATLKKVNKVKTYLHDYIAYLVSMELFMCSH